MQKTNLSEEGVALLNDSVLYHQLSLIAGSIGITPEEYLLRFEEVLSTNPDSIISIFES